MLTFVLRVSYKYSYLLTRLRSRKGQKTRSKGQLHQCHLAKHHLMTKYTTIQHDTSLITDRIQN